MPLTYRGGGPSVYRVPQLVRQGAPPPRLFLSRMLLDPSWQPDISAYRNIRTSALLRLNFRVGVIEEKGVRYRKPERPFGCFALSVPDPFFQTTLISRCHKALAVFWRKK